MPPEVPLLFHPTAINCLAWSEDGQLAIAAGELVHILVPRRRCPANNHEKSAEGPWEHIQFRVNTFTTDEWPIQEVVGINDFSIGEEQSTSTVTALTWSPPGLAKHRRSVLMVLTSNLVVSFWVSTSDPTVTATWHRVFILNNAVKKSWERRCFSKRLPIPTRSVWRRKLRVRSMAWAPQIRRWPKNHARPVEATWGTFLLAVSNDDGEIILLLISSPYTANSTSWDANIVKLLCFDGDEYLPQDPIQNDTLELLSRASNPKDRSSVPAKHKLLGRNADNANHRPSLFRSAIRSKPFIHNIAWSPWTYSPDAESLLSFTRGGAVFHCVFHVSFIFPTSTYFSYVPRFSLKWQFRCKENSFNLTDNLIAWHGSPINGECFFITSQSGQIDVSSWGIAKSKFLVSSKRVHAIQPGIDRWNGNEDENLSSTSHSWDQITGLASSSEDQATYLYLSTHLSQIAVLNLTMHSSSSHMTDNWQEVPQTTLHKHMIQIQQRYDQQNDLGGLSVMKTWGLASLNGYIAACVTVHPGDMTEYIIPSQERAYIVFAAHGFDDPSPNLEHFAWDVDFKVGEDAKTQAAIVETLFRFQKTQYSKQDFFDNRILYAAALASMLMWDNERSKRLWLAQRALDYLEFSTNIDLAPEKNCLLLLITTNLDVEESITKIKEVSGSRSRNELSASTVENLIDICPFCRQAIVWELLTEAFCIAGHQFVRCNLTFLAIKEPGISKYCETCNRQYLNEHAAGMAENVYSNKAQGTSTGLSMPAVEEVADDEVFDDDLKRLDGTGTIDAAMSLDIETIKSKPHQLAAMLFETFNICPYCGGNFID